VSQDWLPADHVVFLLSDLVDYAVEGSHEVIVACTQAVFGLIKRARGFRQFLLRGLARVQAGWALICTGHNLLRLWRSGRWGGADSHGSPLSSARSERACV
jgi:hypothetical protein